MTSPAMLATRAPSTLPHGMRMTRHGWQRSDEREITMPEIASVVRNPEKKWREYNKRMAFWAAGITVIIEMLDPFVHTIITCYEQCASTLPC